MVVGELVFLCYIIYTCTHICNNKNQIALAAIYRALGRNLLSKNCLALGRRGGRGVAHCTITVKCTLYSVGVYTVTIVDTLKILWVLDYTV